MPKKNQQTQNTKKSKRYERQSWTMPKPPPEVRPVNVTPPPQGNSKPESSKPDVKPDSPKPEANKPKK